MSEKQKNREFLKQDFIQKIGPWAFYSYNPKYWSEMSDKEIIEGALLHAPEKDKLKLLELYSLSQIEQVWKKYVVIQAEWHKAANLWAAKNIFKVSDPEGFVQREFRKSQKRRLKEGVVL